MSHNKSQATTARNKAALQQLLNEPLNKHCADCKTSRNPRWASWNLGVFICIRCSGIHRSLGTHISRVKSVDLDSWTDEQTQSMLQWGNARANAYWEARLASRSNEEAAMGGYVPMEGKVESFVRTKYVLGKWKDEGERDPTRYDGKIRKTNHVPTPVAPVSAPKPVDTPQAVPKTMEQPKILPVSQNNGTNSTLSLLETSATRSRPDLKKSILSLYSTPSSSRLSTPMSTPTISTPMVSTPMSASNSTPSVNSSWTPIQPTNNVDDPFRNVWN